MKKTSRRSFAKIAAAGVVGIPFAPTLVGARDKSPSTTESKTSSAVVRQRSEHNTPPPILLMEGSLIVEANTDRNDWGSFQTVGITHRRKWLVTPRWTTPPDSIYIAHIKVVDGSGDILFRFDNDTTSDHATPIVVSAIMKKGGSASGDCQVSVEGNQFSFNLPDSRKIDKRANNEPPDEPLNRSRNRIRFMDNNRDDRHDFSILSIDKGSNNLYRLPLDSPPSKGKELRVMLWWEEL